MKFFDDDFRKEQKKFRNPFKQKGKVSFINNNDGNNVNNVNDVNNVNNVNSIKKNKNKNSNSNNSNNNNFNIKKSNKNNMELDVNKRNKEMFDNLMDNASYKTDDYWDSNNWVVKLFLFVLFIIIVAGVAYYVLSWLNFTK